jgi:hypothetical protein
MGGMTCGVAPGLAGWPLGGLETLLDVRPSAPGGAIKVSCRSAVLTGGVTLAGGGAVAALEIAAIVPAPLSMDDLADLGLARCAS